MSRRDRQHDAEPRFYTIKDVLDHYAKSGGELRPLELISGHIVGDDPEILFDVFVHGRPIRVMHPTNFTRCVVGERRERRHQSCTLHMAVSCDLE
jgi:hypothetical protein